MSVIGQEAVTIIVNSKKSLEQEIKNIIGIDIKMNIQVNNSKDDNIFEIKIFSDDIPITNLGILGVLLFRKIRIYSFGGVWEVENKEVFSFDLNVDYDHQVGGSNGHALGVLGRPIRMFLSKEVKFSNSPYIWKGEIL